MSSTHIGKLLLVALVIAACFAHGTTLAATRIVNLGAYDVVYDPYSGKIYASVTATNSIAVIDPVTGTVETSVYVGSVPQRLAISDDGRYVYVALDGAGKVRVFDTQTRTAGLEFAIGTSTYYGTLYAEDISVQPGNRDVVAVSTYRKGVSPRHNGVAIYDKGIKRANQTPDHTGSNVIEFSDFPQTLYGYNNETTEYGLRTMLVNEFGVSTTKVIENLISGFSTDFRYDDGYIYSTTGRVVDAAAMQLAGTYSGASGYVRPDSSVWRTYYVSGATIKAYNQSTFALAGQETIAGISGSARNLIRWGTNGLAFSTTGNQVVIVDSTLVPTPPTVTSLTIEGPDAVNSYKAQYQLIATYSNGVSKDVTNKSRWSTDPNTYAQINNSAMLFIVGTDQSGTAAIKAQYFWAGANYEAVKNISYAGTIPATGNLTRIEIEGPRQVVRNSTTQYRAIAFFDDGSQYDVTTKAVWRTSAAGFASVDNGGLLAVGSLTYGRDLALYAKFGFRNTELEAVTTVICLPEDVLPGATEWPMYQANAQHTGYVPISLAPEMFSLRWTKDVFPGRALHPVTAVGGRVFASINLYFVNTPSFAALDSVDGATLWSKNFGSVYSINPPACSYGNVYIQLGKPTSGSPYLYAYDAATGVQRFASVFSAQWESYNAPTIYDGSVYVNGGTYGGMYGFNAFSGSQQWFRSLAQYDGWTPAVEGDYCYAQVNGTLSVVDRYSGTVAFTVANSAGTAKAPVKGAMEDIIVISSNKLIVTDLVGKKVKWTISGAFTGQPSVAGGVIYAINGGLLEARNESDGVLLWSWRPPTGSLAGAMVVTDSHVMACTGNTTYAIELLSREAVWSYPAAGHLALANDTLYIAASSGTLTAINAAEYIPASIVRLAVEGPADITESSTQQYSAMLYYSDGRVRDRTRVCRWSVVGACPAAVEEGRLAVGELLYPEAALQLRADFEQGTESAVGIANVTVHIGCTVNQLVARNLEGALKAKQEAQLQLAKAMERERASVNVIRQHGLADIPRPDANKALSQVRLAIVKEMLVEKNLDSSMDSLAIALGIVSAQSPYLPDMQKFKGMLNTGDDDVRAADLNGDGIVNALDIAEIAAQWMRTCPPRGF